MNKLKNKSMMYKWIANSEKKLTIFWLFKLLLISVLVVFMLQEMQPFLQTVNFAIPFKLRIFSWILIMRSRFFFNVLLYFHLYLLLFLAPGFRITATIASILMYLFGWIQYHVIV